MRSLRMRIVAWVLAAIGALLVPLVLASYRLMMEEMEELGDARLAQDARTLAALVPSGVHPAALGASPTASGASERMAGTPGHSYEEQVGLQFWANDNELLYASDTFRSIALDAAPAGFADIRVAGRRWRVFTVLVDGHWVRSAERYDSRREIAHALAVQAITPVLVGLPLLALLVGWAVHGGLGPLRWLADQLARRRPGQTEPLGGSLPVELQPVVLALNGLLQRLSAGMEREREFAADAAHELRTPLAGAMIQVENARAALPPGNTRDTLGDARTALVRLSRLVDQQLDLSRWDAGQVLPMMSVDLAACVDAELAELGDAIVAKDMEVSFDRRDARCLVAGWEPGLRTLVRNLLDNAVRHNVEGGRIDVSVAVDADAVSLVVGDDGPGIDPALRSAMFTRFRRGEGARGEGSGLGLPLAARIAEVHHATLAMETGRDGRGLRVEVRFPPAQPAQP
jgi:two-component system sensor histidine kinase QseC